MALQLHDGRVFEFQCDGAGEEGTSPEFEKTLPVPIAWKEIKGVEVARRSLASGARGLRAWPLLLLSQHLARRSRGHANRCASPRSHSERRGGHARLSPSEVDEDDVHQQRGHVEPAAAPVRP